MEACKQWVDPLIGRVFLGRYEVVELLGEGSMGTVYRGVEHGPEGREVAIKIMLPHLLADAEMVARFQREAAAARRIQHPCAVEVHEHGIEGGVAFFVMELLQGRELFAELAEAGSLSQERAARIMIQICGALGAAHEQRIVHRDLKPENVMLLDGAADRVKILDFGIAKPMTLPGGGRGEDGPEITRAGALVGTPAYMAPEQCLGLPVDPRTDLYACGVMLYQLVTGRLPFDHDNAFVVWNGHLHERPRPPSTYAPDLCPELEATILKALSKRPEDRQQTAGELRVELLRVLRHLPREERARSPLGIAPPPSSRHGSHVRAVVRPHDPTLPACASALPQEPLVFPPPPRVPTLPSPSAFPQRQRSEPLGPPARFANLRRDVVYIAACVAAGAGLATAAYTLFGLLHL